MAPGTEKESKLNKLENLFDRMRRFKLSKPSGDSKSSSALQRNRGMFPRLKRHGPNKVYVLKGYTTKERVAEKRRKERRIQRNINIVMIIIFAVLFLILFYWLDPIGRFTELARMLGL